MRLEPSVSFLSSTDRVMATRNVARTRQLLRIGCAAWAVLVYVVYWLGYLGVLGGR
jgi:hypothetical protein